MTIGCKYDVPTELNFPASTQADELSAVIFGFLNRLFSGFLTRAIENS